MPTPNPAMISYPISCGIVKLKSIATKRQEATSSSAHPTRAKGLKKGTRVDTTEKINVPTVIVAAKGKDSYPLVCGETPRTNYLNLAGIHILGRQIYLQKES
jgi:hypothetical protein